MLFTNMIYHYLFNTYMNLLMKCARGHGVFDTAFNWLCSKFAQLLESVARAFYRIGAIFTQLSTPGFSSPLGDETVILIPRHFWPLLERILMQNVCF